MHSNYFPFVQFELFPHYRFVYLITRYDFQKNPYGGSPSSIRSFRTILPASARDVYYRDEIGNISTSHLLEQQEAVEVDIRYRFIFSHLLVVYSATICHLGHFLYSLFTLLFTNLVTCLLPCLPYRPRFPLFGGWQTRYTLGYNLPSYEYLYQSGSQYALRMRFMDHIYDNQYVDEIVVSVVLPEGCQ